MSVATFKPSLADWYKALRSQDLETSRKIKQAFDREPSHLDDMTARNFHQLLNLRYCILEEDFETAASMMSLLNVNRFETELLNYYAYFFKGLYHHYVKQYDQAERHFRLAEKQLTNIYDPIEQAEFYYKFALTYYQTRQSVLSINYAQKALDRFHWHDSQERLADCLMLLGINYTDVKQFGVAEENLHEATDYARCLSMSKLISRIHHNLGFLYAEQDMSKAAIKYLTDSLEENTDQPYVQTYYLLAREHFKLEDDQKANDYIDEGIKWCKAFGEIEYKVHFQLLKETFNPTHQFEKIFKNGVNYFIDNQMWNYIKEYAETLADFYRKQDLFEPATKYYHIAVQAQCKNTKEACLK
ncbi:tetratricopeptide repeat protein [Tuberibacillus sp. Marseille-P3662]|uniref:tetratricopeptide repeat protein n=1 Tax=Tuberibacillus sp. Marseille-P3662 TaxID=1965358 RepID=UPI000A1C7C10|nr:hypothetical protein [Tuberibacillus sp. Marseille-P3662]